MFIHYIIKQEEYVLAIKQVLLLQYRHTFVIAKECHMMEMYITRHVLFTNKCAIECYHTYEFLWREFAFVFSSIWIQLFW